MAAKTLEEVTYVRSRLGLPSDIGGRELGKCHRRSRRGLSVHPRPFDFQEPNPVGVAPGLFDSLMASEPSEVLGLNVGI